MAKPMPLTVYGPVTPLSPNVRVAGVLPGAAATILDNGNPIGHATASEPGELLVGVTAQPVVGQVLASIRISKASRPEVYTRRLLALPPASLSAPGTGGREIETVL